MLEELKKEVLKANLDLVNYDLVKFTWGNVSAIDRDSGLFVIKPSGVKYDELTIEKMVVCDLEGNVVEGSLNPSSDTQTHAVLYNEFSNIGSIVHTHSNWATIWAQSGLDVPVYGTTHADTFYGEIPCVQFLTMDEVDQGYEYMTGKSIAETFSKRKISYEDVKAAIIHGHGPFVWGTTASEAVENSVILEEVCRMSYYTLSLNESAHALPKHILDKHYLRKHGKNSYYGQ